MTLLVNCVNEGFGLFVDFGGGVQWDQLVYFPVC